tara:strand:+ start:235 stop:396 length:162 start_codon:yes stop_codon:yes gene_type:complete
MQDDFGNELDFELLDSKAKDEYALHWCMAEAEDYISRWGIEKFLHELRVRLEQ